MGTNDEGSSNMEIVYLSFENLSGELIDEMSLECHWNRSWTPATTLHDCVWVQCLTPPQV